MAAFAPTTAMRTLVGLDHQRRSEAGDFERAGAGRISDQQIGRVQADRIERAAHRQRRGAGSRRGRDPGSSSAGRALPRARTVSCCGLPDVVAGCHDQLAVGGLGRADPRIRAATPARSRPCRPAAAAAATRRARRSHSGTGQRPIRCQPHGVSAGKMQVMRHRDRHRSGRNFHPRRLPPRQRELVRDVAQVGLPGQESEHVDVIGRRAVALDHLRRREVRARRDIAEIGRDALVVADRQPPGSARGLGRRASPRISLAMRAPSAA